MTPTPQKFVDEVGGRVSTMVKAGEAPHVIRNYVEKALRTSHDEGVRGGRKDDKELDGTDYAHPAWWRGHDSGCDGIVLALNDVLDGKKKGGIFGSPSLQKLRERIENIKAEGVREEREACAKVADSKLLFISITDPYQYDGDVSEAIRQRSSK